jgi:hypothetical protein
MRPTTLSKSYSSRDDDDDQVETWKQAQNSVTVHLWGQPLDSTPSDDHLTGPPSLLITLTCLASDKPSLFRRQISTVPNLPKQKRRVARSYPTFLQTNENANLTRLMIRGFVFGVCMVGGI